MIVKKFTAWARTAVPTHRADAASALARAYLYSHLDADERADAVGALTALLDDPSPLVRRALAEAFASAIEAPHHIVLALADDQSSIASIVLGRSPVLSEAELIDCAATSDAAAQIAIAARADLTSPVAAALAEIGAPEALVALARNDSATLPDFSVRRMVERHGDLAELREALLRRHDLPACVRIDLVAATARALAVFVAGRNWMSEDRLGRVTREAKDRAAIVIAERAQGRNGAQALVTHLRLSNQLTVGFILRAILSGRPELFRAALADLSGMPIARVDGLVGHCDTTGFAALYRKAELPLDLLPAFRLALKAAHEVDWSSTHRSTLSRAAVERVLTGCAAINSGELDKLIVLLRRFEAEAARDEARMTLELRAPLALRETKAPLRLTDPDTDNGWRPHQSHAPLRFEPTMPAVDIAAIEAELCAA